MTILPLININPDVFSGNFHNATFNKNATVVIRLRSRLDKYNGAVVCPFFLFCLAIVILNASTDVESDISALVICIIVCLSWAVNHYRDNAITYKEQRDKAAFIIADMQKRQRNVAELDARYTKELADANATIESLRADVSAGRKRLQVAATCAKSTTGASGMGDGESPGLTADAELNYYRLRSGIDKITAQVNYLQEYIRTQCLK